MKRTVNMFFENFCFFNLCLNKTCDIKAPIVPPAIAIRFKVFSGIRGMANLHANFLSYQ